MGNDTMSVTQIRFSEKCKKKLMQIQGKKNLAETTKIALRDFEDLYCAIDELWDRNETIRFYEKEYVYYTKYNLFLDLGDSQKANMERYHIEHEESKLQIVKIRRTELIRISKLVYLM